ncbi:gastrula zinc finger protein XlCGF66.1-like [Leptodactylus fuscus]
MERDRNKMAESILNLTLEIIYQLTGEDYTVLKKTSSGRCQAPVYEGYGGTLSPTSFPSPHPLIQEEINEQKILELTNKMLELLTGEVPIRCQDVAVYFSVEEWEYLEGHKDLYKEVMMEDHQPLTSAGRSSKRTTPERCPSPLLPQDDQLLNKDLNDINAIAIKIKEEPYVSDNEESLQKEPYEEHTITPDTASALRNKAVPSAPIKIILSSGPVKIIISSDSSQTITEDESHRREDHPTKENTFLCSKCGKCFTQKTDLDNHQRIHTENAGNILP